MLIELKPIEEGIPCPVCKSKNTFLRYGTIGMVGGSSLRYCWDCHKPYAVKEGAKDGKK